MASSNKFKELDLCYGNYCGCLHTQSLDDAPLLISDDELEIWARGIYDTGTGTINGSMIDKLAQHYWQAVQAGYGLNLIDINLNSPDGVMLKHLMDNCYQFSAAKNKTQLQQLTALINDNGKIREWAAYKEEAFKLNLKFNKTWLKTEYDLAIAGGTMASKWVSYENTPDAMLRYSTVNDARVRDAHRLLNKITRPVNDPFWTTHYPPNGFNCRCDVDRLPYSATPTPSEKVPAVDETIPPMFRTNLAKQKLVFPKKHPYYQE